MRYAVLTRAALCASAAIALPTLFACLEHPLKPVELEKAQEKQDNIALTVNKDVDILFVIDNSGSMGEEQGTLSANFSAFIDVLEDPEVDANYRIGITTTDNGNPWCTGTSPEGGALRLTSCQQRLSEFIFEGTTPPTDRQTACTDFCVHQDIQVTPTTSDDDDETKPRTWFQRIDGVTNLPAGVTTTEAFQCFGPQGINGCGFESHLESMYKALNRAQNENENSFGFLRKNAILSIIHVTDEADCSYVVDNQAIFLPPPEGNQVFWSDTMAQFPTSAVCWNAGVACTGGPGIYNDCVSENYDLDGNPTADANAVLHPLARYTGLLQGFEDSKQEINPNQEVIVAVIGGVPEGYADGSAEISYQDSATDPQFQTDFGIGPGCRAVDPMGTVIGQAIPPVRMKEFAQNFEIDNQRNLYSVCASDYSNALQAIADAIAQQVRPPCMPACVADTIPSSPELDPQCTLTQETPTDEGLSSTNMVECNPDGSIPGGETGCFNYLTEAEMSAECTMEGWNLEFEIIRSEPPPGGTTVKATCQLSQNRDQDCPNLP